MFSCVLGILVRLFLIIASSYKPLNVDNTTPNAEHNLCRRQKRVARSDLQFSVALMNILVNYRQLRVL
jgi:hypothetical protein